MTQEEYRTLYPGVKAKAVMSIRSLLRNRSHSEVADIAESLVTDALMHLESRAEGDLIEWVNGHPGHVWTYLRQCCIDLYKDTAYYRGAHHREMRSHVRPFPHEFPEPSYRPRGYMEVELQDSLMSLSRRERDIMVLRSQGVSVEGIRKTLHCGQPVIYQSLTRIREVLS